MSDGAKQIITGDKTANRRRLPRIVPGVVFGVLVACVVGLIVSYGIRTPLVLGKWIGPELAVQAEQRGVDLRIDSMNGVGLTDLRLYGVKIGVKRPAGRLIVEAPTVDIIPDVKATLRRRRPVIREVRIEEMDVEAKRIDGEGAPVASTPKRDEMPGGDVFGDDFELQLGAATVQADGLPAAARFSDVYAVVSVPARRMLALEGIGEAAGVNVELTADEEALVADVQALGVEEQLQQLPFSVGVDALALRYDVIEAVLDSGRLDDLEIELRGVSASTELAPSATLRAETSHLRKGDTAIRWRSSEVSFDSGGSNHELTQLDLAYRRDAEGFEFHTEIDDQVGRVEVEGHWHLPTSMVEVNIWLDDFDWDGTMPWPFGEQPPVQRGRVNGAMHGDIDLVHRLLSVDAEIGFSDLVIDVPILADGPVHLDDLELALPVTLDARGKALSIVEGKARIADLAPFRLDGRIVDAGGGTHIFDLVGVGEEIEATQAASQLPAVMTGVIAQSEFAGEFGVRLQMAGHSAYPDSLLLDVDFWGDVEVVEEARWKERELLRAGEPVRFDEDGQPRQVGPRGRWTELDQIPDYVPAAMMAAEDASFFEHGGVDWKGLRMAMVENLEQRALVRGGSTITQQVAKNLFLTHDRTLFRKLQEAFLAWRVEATLTKEEILELYLNVVEWGPEIHGLFAASHYFFEHPPERLTPVQTVMLASILPSPIRFGGAIQSGYLPSSREDKMRRVLENMRFVDDLSWEEYHRAIDQLDEGRIGDLEFEPCADDDGAPEEAVACDEIEVEARDGEVMHFEAWEVAEMDAEPGWAPLTH